LRIELHGRVEPRQRFVDRLPRPSMQVRHGTQIIVVRTKAASRFPPGAFNLRSFELGSDRSDDAGGDLILKLEDVVERPFESLGPKVGAGRRIDELARDANPVFEMAHAALSDVAYAELAPDPLFIDRLAFIGKARVARDHE